MTQHASLTPQRWSAFGREQQILMIANEMSRAQALMSREDKERLHSSYERVLRLVDLTVEVRAERGLRRELLRWRDLVAELYVRSEPDATAHAEAFRALLLLTPKSAEQIPYVLGKAT